MGFGLSRIRFWLAASFATLALPLHAQRIVPESLPALRIPDFVFPESEATLTGWVTAMSRGTSAAASATAKIQTHGWGLWTALTTETVRMPNERSVRNPAVSTSPAT